MQIARSDLRNYLILLIFRAEMFHVKRPGPEFLRKWHRLQL